MPRLSATLPTASTGIGDRDSELPAVVIALVVCVLVDDNESVS
jgi:hypothetical protein